MSGMSATFAAPSGWAAAGTSGGTAAGEVGLAGTEALGGAAVGEAGLALATNPIGWAILGTIAVGYIGYKVYQKAHQRAEAKTKDEAQDQVCSTCQPKNPCEHLRKGDGEGKYRGGSHGNPEKNVGTSSPAGDDMDSHHMPAKKAYEGSGLDPADGPAIQMEPKDHRDTADYGGRGKMVRNRQAQQIRDGNFDQAFDESADNVRAIAKKRGDPARYDQAIKEARAYKDCLKANGLLPESGEGQ